MKSWLKTALYLCTMLSVTFVCTVCFAQIYDRNNSPSSQNWANSPQNWRNSPDNWQNSSQNWENSSQNWKNNPQNWQNSSQNWQNNPNNWQNSANNFNSTNGVYDGSGNRVGYVAKNGSGGLNYFNNDGSRKAYTPGP